MKVTKTLIEPNIPDISYYEVTIETMEGDADDYHSIEITAETEDELRDIIIHCEIMKRCYPNGRGGGSDYDYIGPYFDKYFSDNLSCKDSVQDAIEDYEIVFHDTEGKQYSVKIELDEEMKEEIKNPKMSDKDKKTMYYPKPENIKF